MVVHWRGEVAVHEYVPSSAFGDRSLTVAARIGRGSYWWRQIAQGR